MELMRIGAGNDFKGRGCNKHPVSQRLSHWVLKAALNVPRILRASSPSCWVKVWNNAWPPSIRAHPTSRSKSTTACARDSGNGPGQQDCPTGGLQRPRGIGKRGCGPEHGLAPGAPERAWAIHVAGERSGSPSRT